MAVDKKQLFIITPMAIGGGETNSVTVRIISDDTEDIRMLSRLEAYLRQGWQIKKTKFNHG